jgi:hypothetical protein
MKKLVTMLTISILAIVLFASQSMAAIETGVSS